MKVILITVLVGWASLTWAQDDIKSIDGFKVVDLKKGSIYEQLGLMKGDVIEKFNGTEIKSPEDVMNLYSKFKTATKIEIVINRNGHEKTLRYLVK